METEKDERSCLARSREWTPSRAHQMRIDYNRDPIPPLTAADATWADEWLIARGARSAH